MPRLGSLTSRILSGVGIPSGPSIIPYPTNIDPFDEIIKFTVPSASGTIMTDNSQNDWYMERSDSRGDDLNGILTTSNPGFYGVSDSVFRPNIDSVSWGPGLAFTPEISNQLFTGENGAWSVEWIGKHNYTAPGEIRSITILGQSGGVGWTVTMQVLNSEADWRILVGTADAAGNTGQSFSTNITYTNNTWAHFVVAWQPASATTGRLYIRVNGVLQPGYNTLLTKPTGQDFYRTVARTAIFKVLTVAQLLATDCTDFRLLRTATPWIGQGSTNMALPTNPFNQNLYYKLVTISNPNTNTTSTADNFGISVAVSGNELGPIFIGAYTEDDASNTNTGVVHEYRESIFGRTSSTPYTRFRTLANPNAFGTPANDLFGDSVAVNSTSVFASATSEESTTGTSANGRVYIFNRSTGALTGTINNPQPSNSGGAESVNFGTTLCLNPSGTRLVVGYPDGVSSITGEADGVVYVYDTSGNLLITIDCPVNTLTGANEDFGSSIAVSDTHIIIGQAGYSFDTGDGLRQGRAYIYELATGNLVHTLENPQRFSTGAQDRFGSTVAISSQYAAVYASEDNDFGQGIGQVSVYDVTSGTRLYTLDTPVTRLSNLGNGGAFGDDLAIAGDRLFIGEPVKASHTSNLAVVPMIYVYNITNGKHIQTIKTDQINGSGTSLVVNSSGSMLIATFPGASSSAGNVVIYDRG